MRAILKGVYLETKYPGVHLGAVTSDGVGLLIDCPLRAEEAREWQAEVSTEGEPRYLVLLDSQRERTLGARHFELTKISHALAAKTMSRWSDSFKGATRPIGAESDQLKRITGVRRAVPEVIFEEEMVVELPDREVHLTHRPGPTPGAIWAEIPDKSSVYIGDTVTVKEPPYVGQADIEGWLTTLDVLRDSPYDEYKVLSSRDGLIDRDEINDMARFLRKIPVRLERMEEREDPVAAADTIAEELVEDFNVTKARREIALLRLKAGLQQLYRAAHPKDE
jgi:glyoxylase-like metal-dependent hydrolase (beta-lactamase superfamily II)